MEETQNIEVEKTPEKLSEKRTISFSIMLGLSFVNALFYCFSLLSVFFFTDDFKLQAKLLPADLDFLHDSLDLLLNLHQPLFLFWAGIYALSLAGVVFMWKMKKLGFHLYTCAQLGLLAFGLLFIGRDSIALGDIMLTVLFIVYYALHLKRFK